MLNSLRILGTACRLEAPISRSFASSVLIKSAPGDPGTLKSTGGIQRKKVIPAELNNIALYRCHSTSSARWAFPATSAFEDDAILYPPYHWMKSTPIAGVDKDSVPGMVVVHWEDGDSQQYPNVWLRCNCHCDACYSKASHGKLKYMQHLDLDIQVTEVTIKDGHVLSIKWSDNHVTTLPSNWLRCNRFDQSEADPVSDAKLDLWGEDVMSSGRLRSFEFQDLLESNEALLDWLTEIKALGISLVKNASDQSHQIHKLAKRVGYVSPSTFGTHSDVVAVQNSDMLGFSNGYLQPHTDFSYYVNPSAVGLFHCLKNTSTEGGDSLLIDGYNAAVELRETNPEAFRLLTTYEVEHVAIAANEKVTRQAFHHHARHPLIRLNAFGQLKQITFNEIYHASLVRVPIHDVMPMFAAMKAFNKILLRDDNVFKYKLNVGDILTFNNHRMLHGRSAFTSDTGKIERHLQTCFVDWDCVFSRIRVLKKNRIKESQH